MISSPHMQSRATPSMSRPVTPQPQVRSAGLQGFGAQGQYGQPYGQPYGQQMMPPRHPSVGGVQGVGRQLSSGQLPPAQAFNGQAFNSSQQAFNGSQQAFNSASELYGSQQAFKGSQQTLSGMQQAGASSPRSLGAPQATGSLGARGARSTSPQFDRGLSSTLQSSAMVSAFPSVSSAPQGQRASASGLVAGYSAPVIGSLSGTQQSIGSVSGIQPASPRSEVPRPFYPSDELPRFGAADDVDAEAATRAVVPRGRPPAAGSVESIIQAFSLSMAKASSETNRELQNPSDADNSSSFIREAWAHGVTGSAMGQQSGLATPIEGDLLGGLTGLSLTSASFQGLVPFGPGDYVRSPRHSAGGRSSPREQGTPRDASTPSLKAAALAVVGNGASGLRSGLLSGRDTSRQNSTPGSPRQMRDSGSAHSLMLSAPWQQYKNVATRLGQERSGGDSNCSTPRSRSVVSEVSRQDSRKAGREGSFAAGDYGGPPPRTSQGQSLTTRSESDSSRDMEAAWLSSAPFGGRVWSPAETDSSREMEVSVATTGDQPRKPRGSSGGQQGGRRSGTPNTMMKVHPPESSSRDVPNGRIVDPRS